MKVLVTWLFLTFCGPMYFSPPGSFVHGILQARILEGGAIPFSRDLPDPGIEPTSPLQLGSLPSDPSGKEAENQSETGILSQGIALLLFSKYKTLIFNSFYKSNFINFPYPNLTSPQLSKQI